MSVRHLHFCALTMAVLAGGYGCRPPDKEFEDRRGNTRFISLTGAGSGDVTRDEVLDPEALDEVLDTLPEEAGSAADETLPEGTEPDSEGTDDEGESDRKMAKVCATLVGVPVKKVKIAGNQTSISTQADEAVAIKMTGNQSFLSLNLVGGADRSIEGVCLFLAGNQAEAMVTANVNLGTLVYVGRGNLSTGQMTIAEGYQLRRSYVDLSGNQAHLSIDGDGQFFCPIPRQSGHGTSFSCQ